MGIQAFYRSFSRAESEPEFQEVEICISSFRGFHAAYTPSLPRRQWKYEEK
jgi:hypothetical protein